MKNLNKNSGITLVYLVITIIAMLILIGVTVVASFKEGLFNNAKKGAILTEEKREEEIIITAICSAKAYAVTNSQIDEKKAMFDSLAENNDIKISVIKKAVEDEEYYTYMNNSTDVKNFVINLKSTKGYIFLLDEKFNIIKINGIEISDWNNKNAEELHRHTLTVEEKEKECDCDPDKQIYKCTSCDYSVIEITSEGTGHVWGEVENIKESTCTENGINRKICLACGIEKDETIEALGHKEASQYSYSSQGHYHCCERCGISTTEIEEHNYNPCTVCGYTGRFTITYDLSKMTSDNNTLEVLDGGEYTATITPDNTLTYQRPQTVTIRMGGKILESNEYRYNNINGELKISNIKGNVVISASAIRYYGENTSFTNAKEVTVNDKNLIANIDQSYRVRVFKFIPTETATYKFYSNDPLSAGNKTDPYVYIFGDSEDLDTLDYKALQYSKTGSTSYISNGCLESNDDGGTGYNFSVKYNCTAGKTYYMVIRTYTPQKEQNFTNINIQKN